MLSQFAALFLVSCVSIAFIGPALKRGRKPVVSCSTRSRQYDRSKNYIVRLWELRQPRIIAQNSTLKLVLAQAT
jgi:hypothetical protein